jgi:hypothetical protein
MTDTLFPVLTPLGSEEARRVGRVGVRKGWGVRTGKRVYYIFVDYCRIAKTNVTFLSIHKSFRVEREKS